MKNIKTIRMISHDKCVGCTACENICPKRCIKMKMNLEGFLYPVINLKECVNCGKCYQVCPTVSVKEQKKYPRVLGMINRSLAIRKESSSGGVFYSLARYILESGGIVCGAIIDDKKKVKHILIDNINRIDDLTKSKYVQSDLENCYSLILGLLEQGKKVLFVGTPCQTYGLQTFLHKEYRNLILVDLICHGVPSPGIWHEFVENIERQRNTKSQYISFRDKSLDGWENFGMKIKFLNGSEYIDTQKQNAYMFGFLRGFIDRKCCYECQFKGLNRCSDLTIGDFWNVDNFVKCFNDNLGTSIVFVNTQKGKTLIKAVKNEFFIKKVEEGKLWILNAAYGQSTLDIKNREKFYKKYSRNKNAIEILNTEMRRCKNYE